MIENKYYKTAIGTFVTQHQIRTAMDILDIMETDLSVFIDLLLACGKITAVEKVDDDLVREMIKHEQYVAAATAYRDIHKCSIKEAFETVKSYQKED